MQVHMGGRHRYEKTIELSGKELEKMGCLPHRSACIELSGKELEKMGCLPHSVFFEPLSSA